jgi:2-oxoglutarate ferredoxin oxidoreductase subunit gamma
MGTRYEIRLSGSGGQGIILMAIILAEAIGVYDGKFVSQTQSYGPEARGGSSRADVIMSDEAIDYPKAMCLDLLLAMNQRSCDEYYPELKQGGTLIVDSTFVTQLPLQHAYSLPFTRMAREELKQDMLANIVALGALAELTSIASPEAIEAAVLARVPKGTEKLNRDALRIGIEMARPARKVREQMAILPNVSEEELRDDY